MARRANPTAKASETPVSQRDAQERAGDDPLRCAQLEPIRVVRRELTRPDGTKCTVDVPVYPPFRLEENPPTRRKAPKAGRAAGKNGKASSRSSGGGAKPNGSGAEEEE